MPCQTLSLQRAPVLVLATARHAQLPPTQPQMPSWLWPPKALNVNFSCFSPWLKTKALRARLWFSASCEAVAGISPSSRAPAAPLAGALLISISAVSTRLPIPTRGSHVPVLCCSSVAPRHFPLTPGMRACCRLLRRVRTAGVFEGDVKGGQGATPACWEQCSYPALEDIRFFCAFVRRTSRHDLRQLTAVVLHVSASSISVSAFHAAAHQSNPAPALGRDGGYFYRARRCCSFFAWRRIERFSCRPFSSMCFAVLSIRPSADFIINALMRACIAFFPNTFPIACSFENRSALIALNGALVSPLSPRAVQASPY